MVQDNTCDVLTSMDLYLCPAVLLIAEGESNILKSSREAAASDDWATIVMGQWSMVCRNPPTPIPRRLDALDDRDRTWRRRAHTHGVAVFQRVLQAKRHRVHANF